MSALLQVEDLSKDYPVRAGLFGNGGVFRAVEGVSFSLAEGETLGLVGESGSGKSTTGRMLLRLLEPTRGHILFEGRDVLRLAGRDLLWFRRRAQFVFQDPFSSLNPRHRVATILAEPLRLHGLASAAEIPARVRQLLGQVGLRPELAERYPHEFSGGQRQRIGIARALAVEPGLIVADEPVSALDVSVQAQILNLLGDIQRERNLAMVFVAHDLGVVRQVSHRIAVMFRGRLVELGPAEQVCSSPLHPYTRALLAAAPVPRPGHRTQTPPAVEQTTCSSGGCPYLERCPLALARCRQEIPTFLEKRPGHGVACHAASAQAPREKEDIHA